VAVHRVRADDQPIGDLAVAEAVGHQTQDLNLARAQQARLARAVRRFHWLAAARPGRADGVVLVQERSEGCEHRIAIAQPRRMQFAVQGHQPRIGKQRSQLAAGRERHRAVPAAVEDQRRSSHSRQHVAHVPSVHGLQQRRRDVRARRRALKRREALAGVRIGAG
jgi:hypothetical protein